MPEHVIDLRAHSSIEPPAKIHDLTPGLLLFFSRPSALQTWAEMFGHEWRHVGVTVRTPVGLMIASYGASACFRLDDPYEIMSWYDRVGVARILSDDEEIEAVEAYCRRFEHLERSDAPYTFSGVVVGPIHLLARRRRPGLIRTLLFLLVHLYCRLQDLRYRDRPAYACSTFVWGAIQTAMGSRVRLPLSAHPQDEAAYATPPTARDDLYAKWLCGPTELWEAISPSNRCELDLTDLERKVEDESELVIDLRDNREVTRGSLSAASDHPVIAQASA